MSEIAWVRFFPSNWLGGTRGMSASETGVYITLVCLLYESENVLTNDTGRLARQCGLPASKFKTILQNLIDEEKIQLSDGILSNGKVAEELFHSHQKRTVAKQNANSRWSKKPNKNNGKKMQAHSGRNANQNKNKINNKNLVLEEKESHFVEHGSPEWEQWQAITPDKELKAIQCKIGKGRYFPSKLPPPTSEAA